MIIREEQQSEHEAIRYVVTDAFGQPDEARLVDMLRTDGDIEIALVAELDRQVVGHIVLSRMISPETALGLAPVSVLPVFQRQGVGSALMRAGIKWAQDNGWERIFLLGEPAYYNRFGFASETAAGFSSPYAGPYFMALELAGKLPDESGGVAEYASAFSRLSADEP
ncbi:MAG: N-acetyltransferase [Aquisalinus sp.]|nr:N-acetyltransferase [Aquisalinus sp.]